MSKNQEDKIKELDLQIAYKQKLLNTVENPPALVFIVTVFHFIMMFVAWQYNAGIVFTANVVMFLWHYKGIYKPIMLNIAYFGSIGTLIIILLFFRPRAIGTI